MKLNTAKGRAAKWNDDKWVTSKILTDVSDSKSYKKERMELWKDLDRQYRARHEYYYTDRSNLFIPLIFSSIQNIVPRWVGTEQRVIYLPCDDQNFVPHAAAMTRFFDYQWRKMGGTLELVELALITLKYGLGIGKFTWDKDIRPTKRWQNVDIGGMPTGMRIPVPDTQVIHNGPRFRAIPPWLFFWHPDGVDINTCPWTSDLDTKFMGDLMDDERYDVSAFTKRGLDESTSLWVLDYWQDDHRVMLASVKDGSSQKNSESTSEQEIDQSEEEGEGWKVITPKKVRGNPYWYGRKPYAKQVDYPIERKFFGMSTAEVLQPSQVEMNAMRNLRMDSSALALQPVTLVGDRAQIDEFERYPGSILHALDISEVKQLPTGDIKNAGIVEVRDIYDDVQRTIGSNAAIEGGQLNPSRTPNSTLQQVDQLGSVRIAFKSFLMSHGFLKDASTIMRHLNRQYLPEAQAFAVGGQGVQQWMNLPAEVWEQEWDAFPVVVASDSSPQGKTAELLGFVNAVTPILEGSQLFRQEGIDVKEILGQVVHHYQGVFNNPMAIFNPQAMEQAGMGQQQPGQPMPGQPGMAPPPEQMPVQMPAGVM